MMKKEMMIHKAEEMKIYPLSMNYRTDFPKTIDLIAETTKFLPQGAFFGCQIQFGEKDVRCFAFSDCEQTLCKGDLEWLFQTKIEGGENACPDFKELFSENRNVYTLRYKTGCSGALEVNRYSIIDMTALCKRAMAKNVVVRLVFFSAKDTDAPQVLAFISLPEEITIKGKVYFSSRYPKLDLIESEPSELFESGLSAKSADQELVDLLRNTVNLEQMLNFEKAEKSQESSGFNEDDWEDFSEHDDSDFPFAEENSPIDSTPIDDLELSVRSFNCLKRAGINTIGDLLRLSDDELMRMRNLGRKSYDEVKERLAVYRESRKKPAVPAVAPESLSALIGLSEVKKQVEKILALAKLKRDMQTMGDGRDLPVVLNMEFSGNPGTAKTTVARIFAGLLKEAGMLESAEIVEVGRADLVGKYVGHTADKVKNVFLRAEGKLLFIDEAYSLVDRDEGEFGDEAINTIVQEMENNRDRTIVVFAGYPDKMKEFLDRNPGLRSRVPFRICFSDYSVEEMLQIAKKEAGDRGFTVADDAAEKILALCETARKNPRSGNGRFCRNLIEHAIMNYALRLYGDGCEADASKDFVLREADFEDLGTLVEYTPEAVIGFRG